ncbi:MAG: glycyl-radical enzyme activating protein [Acidimicrobiales bacterium]
MFNIQRFSIHDGPGIRTTVFLKGCTNKCFWCHNPEGLRREIEPEFDARRCMGCGSCVLVCASSALCVKAGKVQYDRDKCTYCLACTKACVTGACTCSARELSVDEVMEEVMEDRNAYKDSGGGVTISGGEPLMQPKFCIGILKRAQEQGIHTTIETAGNVRWTAFESVLPYTDLVLMDLKHLDDKVHRRVTGVSNRIILLNASRLAAATAAFQVRFRTPVVPGVNDEEGELTKIAKFVKQLGVDGLTLVPFHTLAEYKYRLLGLTYPGAGLETVAPAELERLQATVDAAFHGKQFP